MLYLSYIIKYWKVALFLIISLLCVGLMIKAASLSDKLKKQELFYSVVINEKELAYADMKQHLSNQIIEEQNKAIRKVNELNQQYETLEEKHQNEIARISTERNNSSKYIDSLREQTNELRNSSNTTSNAKEGSNTKTTSCVSGESFTRLQELYLLRSERLLDMAEEADKLKSSIDTYDEAWHQLEQKYNN
jgi:hypothetical protein